jgi:hypothetical protein
MATNRPTRKEQPAPCPIPDSTFALANELQTIALNVFTRANPLFTSASNVFALMTQLTWMQLCNSFARANTSFAHTNTAFARVCPTNLFRGICRRSQVPLPSSLGIKYNLSFAREFFIPEANASAARRSNADADDPPSARPPARC